MLDKLRYPLLVLAFIWLIGLLVGAVLFEYKIILIICFVIGITLLILSIYSFNSKSNKWFIWLTLSILFLACVHMGSYQLNHQSVITDDFVEELQGNEIGIRGYIDNRPDINGDLVKFIVKPISFYYDKEYSVSTKERLLIYLYLYDVEELSIVSNWESGMGINLTGTFSEINSTINPGQFNYEEYLQKQAVYWKVVVTGIDDVQLSDASVVNNGINSLRGSFSTKLDSLFNQSQAGFLKSILLGDSGDIPSDLQDDFSITGLSHLLAISGLHFSIIAFIFFAILLKFRVTRENASIIVSIILIFYMILIGLRPSVVRATIMTILMLYGFVFKNKFSALQAFGIALFATTLYNPIWIFDIGFQLSFTITFYILWGYPEVYQKLPLKEGIVKKGIALVIITQLASFPLIYYYFHQYSLVSWIANLILVPFFSSIILPFGLVLLVFGSFNLSIIDLLAEIMSFILNNLFIIIDWIADLSVFHFYGNISSPLLVFIMYIILTWLLIRKNFKDSFLPFKIKNKILFLEKFTIIVLAISLLLPWLTDNDAEITFLDVGQGDSIYIQTIKGNNILIDSGGNFVYPKEEWRLRDNPFDVGEDIVLPFLRYNGVTKLDIAILTHEDIDHIGGYLSIVDNLKIGLFIAEKGFPRTDRGVKLYNKLVENNTKIVTIDSVEAITLDKNSQLIFIPTGVDYSDKENNQSFAIILNIYDTRILFSGDIERIGEENILEKNLLSAIDILKVGHHGSNTSTSEQWLETLQPEEAVISVGKNNHYNHPAQEVLQRLINIGTNVWRTDIDGAIILRVKPKEYYIDRTVNNNHNF
ncbi:MAG: DNA internalization-related competence protein ComEC/Rec2 [Vulcanibacillus sp.]